MELVAVCDNWPPNPERVISQRGDTENWIANKVGYGRCRVEVGIVKIGDLLFLLALFFRPNDPSSWPYKCLADYPLVLAMPEASRVVYESLK